MKSIINIFYSFWFVFFLATLGAYSQDFHLIVDKYIEPTDINFEACESIDITYTLTVNEDRHDIRIKEKFPLCCFDNLELITPLPIQMLPGDWTITYLTNDITFEYLAHDIDVVNNTSIKMQFIVRAYAKSDGSLYYCECCGSEPEKWATGYSSFQPGDNDPAVPIMIGSGTSSGWNLEIDQNVIVAGDQCLTFCVILRSNCSDFDLNLINLNFTSAQNSEITNIQVPSGYSAIQISNPSPNNETFRLVYNNPAPTATIDHNQVIRCYITVEYPLANFTNFYGFFQDVTVTNIQEIVLIPVILPWPFGVTYITQFWDPFSPSSCNICPYVPPTYLPLGTDMLHYLVEPLLTQASLVKYNSYLEGHDGVGCENQYVINFVNTGNTVLHNIIITDDPLPSNIEVLGICNQPSTPDYSYKIDNTSGWIDAAITPPSDFSDIIGLQWEFDPTFELIPGANVSKYVCYRIISPSITPNKVTADFKDKVNCTAPGCNGFTSLPYSSSYTMPISMTYEPRPDVFKKIVNGSVFNYLDEVEFYIVVSNSGEAPFTTDVLDVLPPGLNTIHNVSFSQLLQTDNSQNYLNGQVVTFNFGYNYNTQQLLVSGLTIPGICLTDNTSSKCCGTLYNNFIIHFYAYINDCQKSGLITNTVTLPGSSAYCPNNQDCAYSATLRVAAQHIMEVQKHVRGQADAGFSISGQTYPGGNIDYEIRITNTGNEDWFEPVIVDCLPQIGDISLCNGTARNSEYKVMFRNNSPITYVNLPASAGFPQVEFCQWTPGITCEPECCLNCMQSINYHTVIQLSNDNMVRIKFPGTLACNESIDIIIGCKADVSAPITKWSFNDACINAKAKDKNGNMFRVSPNIPPPVPVQIIDWKSTCCDVPNFTASIINQEINWTGSNPVLNAIISLSNIPGSSIAYQELRMSIVGFNYNQDFEDCFKCKNDVDILGTFKGLSPSTVNGLVHFPGLQWNRERRWGCGTNYAGGVPTIFYPAVDIPVSINLPAPRNIPCCNGCVKLILKIEATDVECLTCERYLEIPILLPSPQVYPSGACGNSNK